MSLPSLCSDYPTKSKIPKADTYLASHLHGPPPVNIEIGELKVLPFKALRLDQRPTHVLVLVVEYDELLACMAYLDDSFRSYDKILGDIFFGEISHDQGKVKVSLIRCFSGPTQRDASRNVVRIATNYLHPKVVISCGSCGGLARKKATLGDLVISAKLSAHAYTEHGKVECSHSFNSKTDFRNLIKSAAKDWKAPLKEPKSLVKIHHSAEILTGQLLENFHMEKKELLKQYPGAIAIKAEDPGVFAAAIVPCVTWIVIRAISYFGDDIEGGTKEWKSFASVMAASFVYHLLKKKGTLNNFPHYQGDQPIISGSESGIKDLGKLAKRALWKKLDVRESAGGDFLERGARLGTSSKTLDLKSKNPEPTSGMLTLAVPFQESTIPRVREELKETNRHDCVKIIDQSQESERHENIEHNGDHSWFEEYFLKPKLLGIKDEICQKLDSFEWITGAYGITGPSAKIPHGHLFITVKREFQKRKVLDDLKEAFGKRSIKYIELLRERKEPPKFTFLADAEIQPQNGAEHEENEQPREVESSGGISGEESHFDRNPLAFPEQEKFLSQVTQPTASGTLMLFGVSRDDEKCQFALTCYHVGCHDGIISSSDAFKGDVLQKYNYYMEDALNPYSHVRRKNFLYHFNRNNEEVGDAADENNNATHRFTFGTYSEGLFDADVDILSIKLNENVEANCPSLNAEYPPEQLQEDLRKDLLKGVPVTVEKVGYKSGTTTGKAVHFLDKYFHRREGNEKTVVLKNVYIVKGENGPFLKCADSGSLVSWVYNKDGENRKYGFAYAVCEVNKIDFPVERRQNQSYKDVYQEERLEWSNSSDEEEPQDPSSQVQVYSDNRSDQSSYIRERTSDECFFLCHNLFSVVDKLEHVQDLCFGECLNNNPGNN